MRIVVADSGTLSGKVLAFVLKESGHDVTLSQTGAEALSAVAAREADAVILDADLPDMQADALCEELRARRHVGPILILSPQAETRSKLRAFERGADDYVVTPCDPVEVAARVDVLGRRCKPADLQALGTVLRVEDVELTLGELTVRVGDHPPQLLTPTEMHILEVLMRNSPMTIGRETLIERVWGYEFEGDSNRVDVYVMRLRRKVEPEPTRPRYLLTVRGVGYAFRRRAEAPPPALDHLPHAAAN